MNTDPVTGPAASATATARAPLMPLDQAVAELLAHAEPLAPAMLVSTFEADGRVLAADVLAALDVPAHDNSAMDGYALRCADWLGADAALTVSQRVAAGDMGQPLAPGSAARIFTGAPVPAGADAVVMQESCSAGPPDAAGGPTVRVHVQPLPGQSIRRRGEDVVSGSAVLRRGQRLDPAALGLAASIGLDRLSVAPRVRVALLSTGDELVMPGDIAPDCMAPGAVYNSNRFFLRALLARLGCVVTDLGIVPDRLDATVAALEQASRQHDVILTSGGVSVGEEDHLKPAVQALGRLDLWQIAIKPGKPFAYGRIGDAHFLGLPGNPVSSFVTFLLLVRPFLLKLQGAADIAPKSIAIPAHFTWAKADKRREFLRVRRNGAGGLDLFANQSSGVLTSVVWGDGLVDNAPGQTIAAGDLVRFIPFNALLA